MTEELKRSRAASRSSKLGLFGDTPRNPRAAERGGNGLQPNTTRRPPMICSFCGGRIGAKDLFISAYVTTYDRQAGHPVGYGQLIFCIHCWRRRLNPQEMALKACVCGRMRGMMTLSVADLKATLTKAQDEVKPRKGTRVAKRTEA